MSQSHAPDDAVRVGVVRLDSVQPGGGKYVYAGRRVEVSCQAELGVVAHLVDYGAVRAHREIVGVALLFQRVATAPDDEMGAPGTVIGGNAREQAETAFCRRRLFAVGHVACGDGMAVQCEAHASERARPLEAERGRVAVADRADVELLPALVHDVPLAVELQRGRKAHAGAVARVEPLAMFGGVEPLPVDPGVVIEARRADEPLETHLLAATEGQRLLLQRWQQIMKRLAIGALHIVSRRDRLKRSEHEA